MIEPDPGLDREATVEAALDVARPTVTVATYGDGSGSVAMTPAAASCAGNCAVTVDRGARVTLTAVPEDGSEFLGWSGPDCSGAECAMTVTADQRVTAVFGHHRSLVVIKAGSGDGTVASSPGGISCGRDCSQAFRTGAVVVLTATPAPGSRFVGWRGGGCSGDGTCTVTLDAATLVEARFSRVCSLTVTRLGEGDGTVTSTPRGISCGRDCSQVFACGTRVQLTAVPFHSTFAGWSGACSGTGPCTVTLVAASTRVDAAFTVCGNGVVEPGEQCDDGNQRDGDGCDSSCRLPLCGNGILDPGEQCDTIGQTAFCDSDCTFPVCGDGLVNPAAGEQCDTAGQSATCEVFCTLPRCGDGLVNPAAGEQCDDGNQIGGDGCSAQCQLEVCGNGILDPGEQCDFGGQTAFCDSDCTLAVCGDGLVNPAAGEQCDDGPRNGSPGDPCSVTCTVVH
jgi:cysteine-rich repeat protein